MPGVYAATLGELRLPAATSAELLDDGAENLVGWHGEVCRTRHDDQRGPRRRRQSDEMAGSGRNSHRERLQNGRVAVDRLEHHPCVPDEFARCGELLGTIPGKIGLESGDGPLLVLRIGLKALD